MGPNPVWLVPLEEKEVRTHRYQGSGWMKQRPREDIARRQASASTGDRPQKMWAPQMQNPNLGNFVLTDLRRRPQYVSQLEWVATKCLSLEGVGSGKWLWITFRSISGEQTEQLQPSEEKSRGALGLAGRRKVQLRKMGAGETRASTEQPVQVDTASPTMEHKDGRTWQWASSSQSWAGGEQPIQNHRMTAVLEEQVKLQELRSKMTHVQGVQGLSGRHHGGGGAMASLPGVTCWLYIPCLAQCEAPQRCSRLACCVNKGWMNGRNY